MQLDLAAGQAAFTRIRDLQNKEWLQQPVRAELGEQREVTPQWIRTTTHFPDPRLNGVGRCRVSPEEADAAIRSHLEHFASRELHFVWRLSPGDQPEDLGARLERHGFTRVWQSWGLALADLSVPIRTNPKLTVELVDTPEQFAEVWEVDRACFAIPPEAVDSWYQEYRQRWEERARRRTELYAVRLDGRLVAFGQSRYFDGGILYLDGAATLPEFRGHGCYATLVAHRLRVGLERDCRLALIQAGPFSAPICQKFGFRPVCEFAMYASPGAPPVEFER